MSINLLSTLMLKIVWPEGVNLTTRPLMQLITDRKPAIIYCEPEPGRGFIFRPLHPYLVSVRTLDHQKLTQKTFKPQNNNRPLVPWIY